jgi:hypothetical protein
VFISRDCQAPRRHVLQLHENNSRKLSLLRDFTDFPTPCKPTNSRKENPDLRVLSNKIMVKVDKQAAGFDEGRPTVADLYGDNPFAQAAKQHWLKEKPSKFRPDALKTEFYDVLEKDGFRFRSLLILENLQFLEKSVVLSAV